MTCIPTVSARLALRFGNEPAVDAEPIPSGTRVTTPKKGWGKRLLIPAVAVPLLAANGVTLYQNQLLQDRLDRVEAAQLQHPATVAQAATAADEAQSIKIADLTRRASVQISSKYTMGLDAIGSGSITKDIYGNPVILSNHHVTADEQAAPHGIALKRISPLTVTLDDGTKFTTSVLASLPIEAGDIAVLKNPTDPAILAKLKDRAIPLYSPGKSAPLKAGSYLYLGGFPAGGPLSVSKGIVSNVQQGDNPLFTERQVKLIQSDAALNEGNSGGPAVTNSGELAGINHSINAEAVGINYIIHAEEIAPFLENAGISVMPPEARKQFDSEAYRASITNAAQDANLQKNRIELFKQILKDTMAANKDPITRNMPFPDREMGQLGKMMDKEFKALLKAHNVDVSKPVSLEVRRTLREPVNKMMDDFMMKEFQELKDMDPNHPMPSTRPPFGGEDNLFGPGGDELRFNFNPTQPGFSPSLKTP